MMLKYLDTSDVDMLEIKGVRRLIHSCTSASGSMGLVRSTFWNTSSRRAWLTVGESIAPLNYEK